jgi:hypothetical protein
MPDYQHLIMFFVLKKRGTITEGSDAGPELRQKVSVPFDTPTLTSADFTGRSTATSTSCPTSSLLILAPVPTSGATQKQSIHPKYPFDLCYSFLPVTMFLSLLIEADFDR